MSTISIILPTWNGSRLIERAIRSVQDQDFQDWELLVVDDGSTDQTPVLVKTLAQSDPRIVYFRNEHNLGVQKTLNNGLRLAKGTYIARIDDDDVWIDKTKLSRQFAFLESHPDHALVGTGVIVVDEEDRELVRYFLPETDAAIHAALLLHNCFVHSSVLFRRELATRLGGYDETPETRHVEDYDLWLRIGLSAKYANLPIYSVRFTVRAASMSQSNKMEQCKKDILLVKRYRGKYPHALRAYVRAYVRLLVYGFFRVIPLLQLRWAMLRFYRKYF